MTRVATCAATASGIALAVIWGCGGQVGVSSRGGPPAAVADAGARDGGDAMSVAVAALGASCPEDAPWTGVVCLGRGYVACPGGMYMDEKSRCVNEAGVIAAAAASASATVEAPPASSDEPATPSEVMSASPATP